MTATNNPNFLDVQHPNLIDTKKFGDAARSLPMGTAGDDTDADVAIRCRVLTRLYAQGNSSLFAANVGISPTRWNNIERSGALSKDVARQIYRKYPEVSLDWLVRGRDDGLTKPRSDELAAAFRAVEALPKIVGREPAIHRRRRRAS